MNWAEEKYVCPILLPPLVGTDAEHIEGPMLTDLWCIRNAYLNSKPGRIAEGEE